MAKFGPYSQRAFRNLYEENRNDFKSVLEEIDNIESELYDLDHLVISCLLQDQVKNYLISII